MNFTNSERLHNEALEHIVGGVNSPSRSYKAVGGGAPVVMERGQGAYFFDVDGNQYIDYLAAYGPIITGLLIPILQKRLKKQLKVACYLELLLHMKSHLPKCLKKPCQT